MVKWERGLVAAIIYKALSDWNIPQLKKDVREFFQSNYGKELCYVLDLSAEDVLRRLEEGKIDAKYLEVI